jgi:glycosyltransferase involved in cell wall biosynthesis
MWQEAGIGRYTRNLVRSLEQIDSQNEYVIFLLSSDFKNLEFKSNFKKVEADFGWYGIKEQRVFPKLINKQKVDLMHFPHFNIPILYRGKFIVTIHDLIHHKFAMKRASTLSPIVFGIKQAAYRLVFRNAVFRAKKIVTVSKYVKKDLEDMYKLTNKIVVTAEGVDESFLKLLEGLSSKNIEQIINSKNVQGDYLFYVGNAHPHKNIEGLIESYMVIRKKYPELKLVLAGKEGYFWKKIMQRYGKTEGLIYLGYLNDLELAAFYKGAKVFVMPSFEEGFGIPILEAFSAGVPVLSSNQASLPEVGGDACLYFDPYLRGDMIKKLDQILIDTKMQKANVLVGKRRAKLFSWKKMAADTRILYEES